MARKTAVRVLAEIKLTGQPFGGLPEGYTWDQIERAQQAIAAARRAGCDWKWDAAEAALDRAYEALGAENPGSGYAWHCGTHPLQTEIERADAEMATW